MKKTNRITVTYEIENKLYNGLYVEISYDKPKTKNTTVSCEAFIYHKDYCYKMLMFGSYNEIIEEFTEMVEANVDDYIPIYMDYLNNRI